MKFDVSRQGKIVVEPDGPGFLVMFPDGVVRAIATKRLVLVEARRWFKRNLGTDIGVGEIEWKV